jgi:hypothetical protein
MPLTWLDGSPPWCGKPRITLYSFSVGEANADGRALTYQSFLSGVRSVRQAAEKSSYHIGDCCLPDGDGTSALQIRAGYHGEIAIDPMTGALLRLELIFDLESTTPLIWSEIMIEYGPVEIGGKSYICPVRSVSHSRGRSVTVLSEALKNREKSVSTKASELTGPMRRC